MRDVAAEACKGVDESFHLVEHAIDYHGKPGERIVGVPMRESFTQVAGDDALYPLVNLNYSRVGARVQLRTGRQAKKHAGNHTKHERPANDARDLPDFIDISS